MALKDEIRPVGSQRVMDLVESAGVNVSNWQRDTGRAASNPKFCYNWSFIEPHKVVVANFWFDQIDDEDGILVRKYGISDFGRRGESNQIRRAAEMAQAFAYAFSERLPVKVIICEGDRPSGGKASRVTRRRLDEGNWAVTSFTREGMCIITRGAVPGDPTLLDFEAELLGFEGAMVQQFSAHRKRERKLRQAKIADFRRKHELHLHANTLRRPATARQTAPITRRNPVP